MAGLGLKHRVRRDSSLGADKPGTQPARNRDRSLADNDLIARPGPSRGGTHSRNLRHGISTSRSNRTPPPSPWPTPKPKPSSLMASDGISRTSQLSPKNPSPPVRVPPPSAKFFLVDPLDGSKEFISRNGEFTVNIALIDNGVPVAGIVYAPAIGRIWWGETGTGSFAAFGRQRHHRRKSSDRRARGRERRSAPSARVPMAAAKAIRALRASASPISVPPAPR